MFDRGAREWPADLVTSIFRPRHEVDRMNVIVDELLLLARLDQKRPLCFEKLDVAYLVRPRSPRPRSGRRATRSS